MLAGKMVQEMLESMVYSLELQHSNVSCAVLEGAYPAGCPAVPHHTTAQADASIMTVSRKEGTMPRGIPNYRKDQALQGVQDANSRMHAGDAVTSLRLWTVGSR